MYILYYIGMNFDFYYIILTYIIVLDFFLYVFDQWFSIFKFFIIYFLKMGLDL